MEGERDGVSECVDVRDVVGLIEGDSEADGEREGLNVREVDAV